MTTPEGNAGETSPSESSSGSSEAPSAGYEAPPIEQSQPAEPQPSSAPPEATDVPPAYAPPAYPPPDYQQTPGNPPSFPPPPQYAPPPGYPPPGYPPPPQGYPPPPQGYPPPSGYPGYYPDYAGAYGTPTPKTNSLAIASLIVSLIGFLPFCGLGSIVGIVLGIIALSQIKQNQEGGRGLAIAGIAVGAVTLFISFILTAVFMSA